MKLLAVMVALGLALGERADVRIVEDDGLVIARVGATVTGVLRRHDRLYAIDGRGWLVEKPLAPPRPQHPAIEQTCGQRPAAVATRGPIAIDVLFAYTPGVGAARTHDGVRGLAAVALAEANRANRASGVDVTFRVAGVVAAASGEAGRGIQQVYDDLVAHRDFADAHAARKARRADVLVLLVDRPRGAQGLAPVMATARTALAVVEHREAVLQMTVAHELGHIMGARHEVEDDQRDFPFPYGHGYVGATGRTIMATPCAQPKTCPLVARWSGPPAWGNAETADDARVLRQTAAAVAAFGDAL